MVLKRPHMELIWGVPPCSLRISILCHNIWWLTKARASRNMSRLILSNWGILYPPLPKECHVVPGPNLVTISPAGQTLCSGSDFTPWLQDSALVEGWIVNTQHGYLYTSPLAESQHDHTTDSPGTHFTQEQQQLFKSWFMNAVILWPRLGSTDDKPPLILVTAMGLSERAGIDKNPWKS